MALSQRKQVHYRSELIAGLAAIADGIHSTLEYRYMRGVERPHELPVAHRQAKITLGGPAGIWTTCTRNSALLWNSTDTRHTSSMTGGGMFTGTTP